MYFHQIKTEPINYLNIIFIFHDIIDSNIELPQLTDNTITYIPA